MMNSLGKFSERRFVSVFRFKTWWSTMWVGNAGSDLQMETQWILLEVPEIASYVLILPLIEGKFRSALHPGSDGHVMICAESGSTKVEVSSFNSIAYVHVCDNPYDLTKEAYSVARVHLDTFKLLEEKSLPSLVDKFGWCTWDAFYLTVEPVGIWHGVKELAEGGATPRFLIMDDGWQTISIDGQNPLEDAKNRALGGAQLSVRLYGFEECGKFRKYKGGTLLGPEVPSFDPKRPKMLLAKSTELEQAEKVLNKAIESGIVDLSKLESEVAELRQKLEAMFWDGQNSSCSKSHESGMKAFTKDLRTRFRGLDDVYVWQALCGAWGGVWPGATHLSSEVIQVKLSPGLDGTMIDSAHSKIVNGGIGLVHPSQAGDFYESMHSYLADSGITGVKVDAIHTLEYLCEEYGGRVELAKAYYNGLDQSLVKNFKGTGLLCSMQQCNDFFFLGTQQISIGRVGDDFWLDDPYGDPTGIQGLHMVHCAYNSMWMGQMIQPDWDMFQSDHLCAKFHAGSRAICGGPIYVSDSVGAHDFELIKKLVYPDGTISKCLHFALPTRDSLFRNPSIGNQTVLKIWNLNKFGGVVGAFNCQGAGWDSKEKRIKGYPQCYKPVHGSVHVTDVEWDQKKETAEMVSSEEYAVYLSQAEKLLVMGRNSDPIQITIQTSSFELFSFVPIRMLGPSVKFAPIGLTNMFNIVGTLQQVEYSEYDQIDVRVKVKGGGKLLAFSSAEPKAAFLDGAHVGFEWVTYGKLTVEVPWNDEKCGVSVVDFSF